MKSFPDEHDAQFTEEGELIAGYARLAGMATAATEPVELPTPERWYVSLPAMVGIGVGVLGIAALLYGAL